MNLRPFALAVGVPLGIGLLLTGQATAQAAGEGASAGWAEMARCGVIANDAARHGCTDEVLRRYGLMASPQARAAEHRRLFGVETPKFRHRQASRAETAGGSRSASEARDEDRITVTLDKVSLRGDGKLVVRTTEGAVWREVETEPVRPMPARGQSMVIERTALGGFMCKIGRWTAFRCTREP